ncbi:S-formylglutathione hydrolase-like [Acanthaster planci]|uniref:S-formylglutathione hydrolase n=1 Tax=Acanthaster planci TaxID=133434 RepID=A0A8B7YN48_ACAPL|nr:S-formylglutathione hydrolase-like [Acanthaster planci]
MATTITEVSGNKSFGGWQKTFKHDSGELKCSMNFGIYLPAEAKTDRLPVLYWLSGLTCTEANFAQKAGAQGLAAENKVIIVMPDTSPRGCNIEGEEDSWDFGTGAGFYVDATEDKWKTNYRMYSYVTKELPEVINANFNTIPDAMSIFGHSMGGHGALICALKNPGKYRSVSAFAPICNPMQCPWGQKAFNGYLGSDQAKWKEYDACELVKAYQGPPLDILVDQGKADQFLLQSQLLPDNLVAACTTNKTAITLRMQEDYDHSYYFIATFMKDHVRHHMRYLSA